MNRIQTDPNEITMRLGDISLKGILSIPNGATSLVIFSHGSGSSRHSPRNNYVARLLNRDKIATLLTDLLTEEEDRIYENRFDIELITERLIQVTSVACRLKELLDLPVGYFGASTGAASALKAAARIGETIHAVVSRGGRPDLAGPMLPLVKCPTLLIVGSLDDQVITLNEQAYSLLTCEKHLHLVKGATHLFEEPGTLDEAARFARDWFKKHLSNPKNTLYAVH